MKRLDLHRLVLVCEGIDIRPSLLAKIQKDMRDLGTWNYKSLCSLTETDLLSKDSITPDVLDKIKVLLGQYGLRLGMTEKELDDYMDAEYLEEHPEESATSKPTISIIEEQVTATDLKDKVNDDFYKEEQAVTGKPASSISFHESTDQPFDENKEAVKAVRQTYQDPLERFCNADWEWYGHQARLFFLTSQPWYIKCFVPFKKRLKRAFKQADELISEYRTDMATRSLFFRKLKAHGQYEKWKNGEELF